MVASLVREANRKARKKREGNGNKYEHQVNVNHAIGVYKDNTACKHIARKRIVRYSGYTIRYFNIDTIIMREYRVVNTSQAFRNDNGFKSIVPLNA